MRFSCVFFITSFMRFFYVSRAFLARLSCISRAFLVRLFAFLMRFFCVSFAFLSPRTLIQVLRTRSSMQALPIKVLPTFSQETLIKMNIQTRPIGTRARAGARADSNSISSSDRGDRDSRELRPTSGGPVRSWQVRPFGSWSIYGKTRMIMA